MLNKFMHLDIQIKGWESRCCTQKQWDICDQSLILHQGAAWIKSILSDIQKVR